MRILLSIFSGTGNTLRVGKRIAEQLIGSGNETDIYLIRESSPMPNVSEYDMLIVGYPVHAFNAPTAALGFLKKLPNGCGKKAYLFRTSGEPLTLNDASGIAPRRILSRHGYNVLGEFSYVMPYNIIFKHSEKMAARMWQAAINKISRDVAEIVAGKGSIRRVNAFKRVVSFTLRIEHAAMPIIGRTFKADKAKCTGCGACSSLCPKANITMDGVPKFGKRCVGCMACAFGCPSDAIKISLLNGWRVNGKYSFDGLPATDDEVCKYCRKAYIRYFHDSEDKYSEK